MGTSPSRESARHQAPAPASVGRTMIRGHHLYWERYGDPEAPAMVLLHHGLGSIHSWRRQIPAFASAGWQVIAYDRWGYGRSDPRPGFEAGYLLQDMHEAIELLEALGLARVSLVGHSDGGTIALLMAAEYPERVERMVGGAPDDCRAGPQATPCRRAAKRTRRPGPRPRGCLDRAMDERPGVLPEHAIHAPANPLPDACDSRRAG